MIVSVLIALFIFFVVIPIGVYTITQIGDALPGIIGLVICIGFAYWAYTLVSEFYIAHTASIILVGKIVLTVIMLVASLLIIYYTKLRILYQQTKTRFIGKYGTHIIKTVTHTSTGKSLNLDRYYAKIYNKKTTYSTLSDFTLYTNTESIYVHPNHDYLKNPYADEYTSPVDIHDKTSCVTIFDELWLMRTRKLSMILKPWKSIDVSDIFIDKQIIKPESFSGLSLVTTINAYK